jgi:hypothetical protein
MTPALRATFTTAMRVIDWIHRRSANVRTPAKPSLAASFSKPNRHVIGIPNFSERGSTSRRDTPNLAAWQTNLSPIRFPRNQRGIRTSTAAHSPAATRQQFDAMNIASQRDVLQRQAVANIRRRIRATLQPITNLQIVGSQNVTLLAVDVMQQGNPGTAVRIVFNRRHFGRHAIFVSPKVNQPILSLVTTATMSNCDLALIVAPALFPKRPLQ